MALQLAARRGLLASSTSKSAFGGLSSASSQLRFKSTDAGDVIGIDLGTTNSCVAIMVRRWCVDFATIE